MKVKDVQVMSTFGITNPQNFKKFRWFRENPIIFNYRLWISTSNMLLNPAIISVGIWLYLYVYR